MKGALLGWLAGLVVFAWAPPLWAADDVPRKVLTLKKALELARIHQPALRSARAAKKQAEADADAARAPLLPQLVGTLVYQKTTANFVARPGAVPSSLAAQREPNFDLYNWTALSATASQLVYDFGRSHRRFRAEKHEARAAAENERSQMLSVDASVRLAFFDAQAARALVAVAEAALANTERHLAQVQAFVEVGTRPEIDLAQIRAEAANARVVLIQSQNNYELARLRLNQAMGVEGDIAYDVETDALAAREEERLSTDELLARAFAARPDLAALEQLVRARELDVSAARGGYGPSVTVSTTVTEQGVERPNFGWNWNAGVTLNWPLLEGGLTRAQVRSAEAQVARAQADRDALRQAIRVQVEEARLSVISAQAVLEASQEAINAARQRLALAEGRYEAGVGSIIELGDAQLALTQAEAQHVQAQYGLSLARTSLMQAVGSVD